MANPSKIDLSYYMPLSNGQSPKDGPTISVFSAPKFNYSPQTQEFVKHCMSESRLTSTQKTGFQALLRSGKPLPSRPSDVYRQQLYKHKHAERARALGLPVLSHNNLNRFPFSRGNAHMVMTGAQFPPGGRRSYETIRSSGELDPTVVRVRRYIPFDKEQEKVRFAHRMAFGKDPPPKNAQNKDGSLGPKVRGFFPPESSRKSKESILNERFLELYSEIKDRAMFLEGMRELGNERAYKASIVSQIQGLVNEMKGISKDKTDEYLCRLELEKVDKCFEPGGYAPTNSFMRESRDEYHNSK